MDGSGAVAVYLTQGTTSSEASEPQSEPPSSELASSRTGAEEDQDCLSGTRLLTGLLDVATYPAALAEDGEKVYRTAGKDAAAFVANTCWVGCTGTPADVASTEAGDSGTAIGLLGLRPGGLRMEVHTAHAVSSIKCIEGPIHAGALASAGLVLLEADVNSMKVRRIGTSAALSAA